MKERPILMSAEMVRALLAGRKTQTRRLVKLMDTGRVKLPGSHRNWHLEDPNVVKACPYGLPGDRLWVRETYYQVGHWEPVPGIKTKTGKQKWKFVPDRPAIRFDQPPEYRKGRHHKDPQTVAWHKRLARFMPRKASRLTLEIKTLRVERLQDISEADAKAEGIQCPGCQSGEHIACTDLVKAYRKLWESLNGTDSWKANPWVWVIEFQLLNKESKKSGKNSSVPAFLIKHSC